MLTVGSIIVTVFGVLVVCYSVLSNRRVSQSIHYSVVIEGGSRESRIHIFEIEFGNYARVAKYTYSKLHQGPLMAYAYDPRGGSVQLNKLLKFAKGEIPKGKWKETEVRLIATTGNRLLKLQVQEKILKVARKVLQSSGFMFRDEWASVISDGSEDFVNAWVITNLALSSFRGLRLNLTEIVVWIEEARGVEYVFAQSKLCLWRICLPKPWRFWLF